MAETLDQQIERLNRIAHDFSSSPRERDAILAVLEEVERLRKVICKQQIALATIRQTTMRTVPIKPYNSGAGTLTTVLVGDWELIREAAVAAEGKSCE